MVEPLIGAGPENAEDLIKDTSTENFMVDVIEASKEVPVLVDFWAPWCEPCKQLGPTLEKVVKSAGGKVKLVKLNIDDHPQIAQQLQIQSIPAVFAFKNGQPIDGFVGAQTEGQIKNFIERLAGSIGPSPIDQALEAADNELIQEDFVAAENLYSQVIRAEPENLHALGGLARAYIGSGELKKAKEILDTLPEQNQSNEMISAAKSALSLMEAAENTGDINNLKSTLENNPDDNQTRFDLAIALAGSNSYEEAITHLLEIITKQKDWNNGVARDKLLKIFEALGPKSDLTINGRRRLSALIFS